MRRDWELIRWLLMRLETDSCRAEHWLEITIDDVDTDVIDHHMRLLEHAGLVAFGERSRDSVPLRLTWAGHELLDAIRHDATWERAKGALSEQGFGMTFEALKLAVKAAIEAAF